MKKAFTRAQRRVLRDLANGGCFFAAVREPDDFEWDGRVFSESIGIVVHRPGSKPRQRYRVRNKTAGPLYLATPSLVDCHPDTSGFRCFEITEAGRAALAIADRNGNRQDGETRLGPEDESSGAPRQSPNLQPCISRGGGE